MQKQTQFINSAFHNLLKKAYSLIQQEQIQSCIEILKNFDAHDEQQKIQINSLIAYSLFLQKQYQSSFQILNQCLKKRPYHLASRKRKALILQKVNRNLKKIGDPEDCLRQFQLCLYLEPESKSLRTKVKRLSLGSAKSESASSQGNNFEQKLDKNEPIQQICMNQQEKSKPKTPSVKFGNFEVIQIATQDSDEHFALIKQQINKLSNKKPKKSILKESKSSSVFEDKPQQKALPDTVKIIKQGKKQQNQQQQKHTSIDKDILTEKIKYKKKSKSVTFKGDTNLEDFN